MPSPSPALRILQISDPHLFDQSEQRLLNVNTDASLQGIIYAIREHEKDIDMIVATGDIAQDASPGAYQRFIDMTQSLSPMLRGLPGNHDHRDTFAKVWGEHAQAITDIGRWRLVCLDSSIPGSSAGHLASDQLELLRDALATASGRHVLVAVHHNPVPIGSGWLDSMLIDNGHELLALLQQFSNARGLIWGHVHQEFDSVYNFGQRQLRLLATPATCIQFTPRSQAFSLDCIDPGYRRIELYDDGRIDSVVVRVAGLDIHPDTESTGY